jgi:hypothetical protein
MKAPPFLFWPGAQTSFLEAKHLKLTRRFRSNSEPNTLYDYDRLNGHGRS